MPRPTFLISKPMSTSTPIADNSDSIPRQSRKSWRRHGTSMSHNGKVGELQQGEDLTGMEVSESKQLFHGTSRPRSQFKGISTQGEPSSVQISKGKSRSQGRRSMKQNGDRAVYPKDQPKPQQHPQNSHHHSQRVPIPDTDNSDLRPPMRKTKPKRKKATNKQKSCVTNARHPHGRTDATPSVGQSLISTQSLVSSVECELTSLNNPRDNRRDEATELVQTYLRPFHPSLQGVESLIKSMPPRRGRNKRRTKPSASDEAVCQPKSRVSRQLDRTTGKRNSRPSRRNTSDRSAFLRMLPSEVRNLIYRYVIPDARIMIFATSPKVEVAEAKKLWINQGQYVKQPRSRLYCGLDRQQVKASLRMSTSMLLVNRQISREVQHFFYSQTTFCFPSLKILCKFAREASQQGISSIKSIELESRPYGEPHQSQHRVFKERYDRKWWKVCDILGLQMTSLARLELHSYLTDWPAPIIEGSRWHKALMQVVQVKKLHDAAIHLTIPRLGKQNLTQICQKIEQSMMTPSGLRQREDRKAEASQKAKLAATRPIRCLNINLGTSAASTSTAGIS